MNLRGMTGVYVNQSEMSENGMNQGGMTVLYVWFRDKREGGRQRERERQVCIWWWETYLASWRWCQKYIKERSWLTKHSFPFLHHAHPCLLFCHSTSHRLSSFSSQPHVLYHHLTSILLLSNFCIKSVSHYLNDFSILSIFKHHNSCHSLTIPPPPSLSAWPFHDLTPCPYPFPIISPLADTIAKVS